MRLYPDSKVYIICPGNINTGEPEVLHQLCSTLIQFGVNAFMFYMPDDAAFNADDPVHPFIKNIICPTRSTSKSPNIIL